MKHTLTPGTALALTLALGLGWPLATQAQTSQVEVYGRIDLSANVQRTSATATTASQRRSFLSPDIPWLGFRGTEDLGGGLRAFFKLEHGFNADTGLLSSPVPGQFWNRETVVGLGDAAWGQVQLGSQFTPSLMLTARLDPYRRTNAGAIMPMFQQGLAGPLGYTAAFNNAIQYISPNFQGVRAKLLVGATEGVAPGGRPLSLAVEYTLGQQVFAGFSHDRVKIAGAAVGQPTRPSVDLVTTQLGLVYQVGAVKLHSYFIRTTPDGAPGMQGGMLGLSVPVGVGEVISTVQQRDANNADAQTLALQYTHHLSKRTLVYVGAAHQRNEGTATFGVWPSRLEAGPAPAGASVTGYQLGMRHHF